MQLSIRAYDFLLSVCCLDLIVKPSIWKSRKDNADKLKGSISFAYDLVNKEAIKATEKHKTYTDRKIRYVELKPGDQMLIRIVGIKGKNKLADIRNKHPYIVNRKPIPNISVLRYIRKDSFTERCSCFFWLTRSRIQRERLPSPAIVQVSDDKDQYERSSESSSEHSLTQSSDEIQEKFRKFSKRKEHKISEASVPCDKGHKRGLPQFQEEETESG